METTRQYVTRATDAIARLRELMERAEEAACATPGVVVAGTDEEMDWLSALEDAAPSLLDVAEAAGSLLTAYDDAQRPYPADWNYEEASEAGRKAYRAAIEAMVAALRRFAESVEP